jgi:hypothetical protein
MALFVGQRFDSDNYFPAADPSENTFHLKTGIRFRTMIGNLEVDNQRAGRSEWNALLFYLKNRILTIS